MYHLKGVLRTKFKSKKDMESMEFWEMRLKRHRCVIAGSPRAM